MALAAALGISGTKAQDETGVPVAEPAPATEFVPQPDQVPTAEPSSSTGAAPTAMPVPVAEPVSDTEMPPAAKPVPVAEPISDSEEVSDAENTPATGMIPVPKPPGTAAPAPVAKAASDTEMVPVAEPITNAENVGAVAPVVDAGANPETEMSPSTDSVPSADGEPVLNGKLLADDMPEPKNGTELVPEMIPVAGPGIGVEPIVATELEPDPATDPYSEENLALGPPWVAPEEETMTLREMFLQSHREQLEIYDLNHDNVISEEEWKAANEDDLARGEKFFVVDKNEDGEIDENEAVGFLMERVSLSSTYIDATSDETTDITRGDIKEAAPSELRVTLFSIPLGD